jgi:hypothetical protein
MIRKLGLIIFFMSLVGCASGVQKMRNIDPGMIPQEVEAVMGSRDSFKSVEKDGSIYTLYQYTNQYCNANVSLWEKCDFFIIFKDGKVVETGVKNVRSYNPNMVFLYLFQ